MPITSNKIIVGPVATLIYTAAGPTNLIIQTPQGTFFLGGPGVNTNTGFLTSSITGPVSLTLRNNDQIYGISLPGETALAYILIQS